MKNLDYVAGLYFHNVSAYNIFHGNINYAAFDEKELKRLMFTELPNISDSEAEEICAYLKAYGKRNDIAGNGIAENGLNVFRALKEITVGFLEICHNQPICRYEKLIAWKKLVEHTGEDMLVCAFLAKNTEKTGMIWDNFMWNPVIGHDNMQLNRIMQRGLSDNHFHLFGSAPSFKLTWLRLMNDFSQENYVRLLQKIDEDRRQVGKNYSNSYREETLVQLRFKAGLIRAYLISYMDKVERGVWREADELENQQKVQRILESEHNYFEYYAELQNYMDGVKLADLTRYVELIEDYACKIDYVNDMNQEFAGERKLMYQMLLGNINGQRIPEQLMNWFYAYLVIQVRFRGEFTQVNEKVGFENFNIYSRRKSGFLDRQTDTERMIRHAVGGSMKPGNIRSLELRITPEKTAEKNREFIEECNYYIREKIGETAFNATYYVLHFPKKEDQDLPPEQTWYIEHCRHYEYREELKNQAEQIVKLREWYPETAKRVLGIDACAQELYCRPEVFAPTFRMLSRHVVSGAYGEDVEQLRITYHVGEDWYDIVDGLRAIDEAITFLGMRNGDRLGHATVLGIDIQDWYAKKNSDIWLSLQNYLDNVVWLYHKLIEFDIRDCEALKGFLLSEYDRYFRELYGDIIREIPLACTIDTYYISWKLRGDQPQLYETGKFEMPYFYTDTAYSINEYFENGDSFRRDREAALLMHYYHYSAVIRNKGAESTSKKVSDIYIKGVQKVQKAMQKYVSRCGISIETNPSSNYKISTIDKYEKHPILNFYNMGLTWDDKKIRECPQLHISINTDDKGIFDTSLENEFALMGCAVEHMEDDCGEYMYSKQMVYDWLNRIRQNGNQQSFLK